MESETISESTKGGRKSPADDEITETIEQGAKEIPNLGFLTFALTCMAASAFLQFKFEKRELGNFIGMWVPTILIFGLYNKVVKLEDKLAF